MMQSVHLFGPSLLSSHMNALGFLCITVGGENCKILNSNREVLRYVNWYLKLKVTEIWELYHGISYNSIHVRDMAKNPASNRVFSWARNLTASLKFTKARPLLPW